MNKASKKSNIQTTYKGIILIILSSICVSIGQLLWKLGVEGIMLYIIVGFLLYGVGAVLMFISYKFGAVSTLQPLISISYIIAIFLGYFILNETITYGKIIGIILIFTGTVLLSKENI